MGGDIYTLSQILGHSSVQVTEQCFVGKLKFNGASLELKVYMN